MYKIKRFSWENKFIGGTGGAMLGAGLANKISKGSGRATLIGAGLGLAGGLYLGNKMDKFSDKMKSGRLEREKREREEKARKEKRYRYPDKSIEYEYPAIVELGGMPKEYYQTAEICKKIDSLNSHPTWGDGDEYLSLNVSYLYEVDDVITGEDTYYTDINKFPLIRVGFQDECLLAYNFNKRQWFDLSYRTPKKVTNLKIYILKEFENDLKVYRNDYSDIGDEYIDEVERYYKDIIRIIKSSKLG